MYFILDDERTLGCELIARTPEAAKEVLKHMSNIIECFCVDHDLGTTETGYDVIKWAWRNKCLPEEIQIVTMNPVGRKNIADMLIAAGYQEKGNSVFERGK